MSNAQHKCDHAPCKCIIDSASAYCSPQCERRDDNGDGPPCRCGHDDCDAAVGITPLPDAALA